MDDASEGPGSPAANGTSSPRENGLDKLGPSSVPLSSQVKKEVPPPSPRSGTSSNASTPSAKKMEEREKPTTPISKPVTPTSAGMFLFWYLVIEMVIGMGSSVLQIGLNMIRERDRRAVFLTLCALGSLGKRVPKEQSHRILYQ